jgi:hypothetical protein
MATYSQIYNLHANSELRNKVTVACSIAAQAILSEATSTDNHAARLLWARAALVNPQEEATRMMWGILGNPTIQNAGAASTDGDVQWVVNSLINTFAAGA